MKRKVRFDEGRALGVQCTKCEWMASTSYRSGDLASREKAELRLIELHSKEKEECKQPIFVFNR